jgi:hypothetical protein
MRSDNYSERINKSASTTEEEQENFHFHYLCPEQDDKKSIVSPIVVEPSKDIISKSIASDNSNNVIPKGHYVSEQIILLHPSFNHSTNEPRKDDETRMMTHSKNNNKLVTNNNNIKNCHNSSGSIACKNELN